MIIIKYAIIDLGSNTIRLSVYKLLSDGGFDLLFSEKETAGLIRYVKNDILTDEGLLRACTALKNFKTLLRQFDINNIGVFATASLRNIKNTDAAVAFIKKKLDLDIDVISGETEAKLGYYGSVLDVELNNGAIIDIGGGSTEIIEIKDKDIISAKSIPIGSLKLFDKFVEKIWPKKAEIERINSEIKRNLKRVKAAKKSADEICMVGGTARAVLRIANELFKKDDNNFTITSAELDELTSVLFERDKITRKLILNASPDRLHTLLPGLLLMVSLVRKTNCKTLFISKFGVREGYLCHKFLTNMT